MTEFLNVKEFVPHLGTWYRELAISHNNIMRGKTNNTGSFTLTANTTTTTIQESEGRVGEETQLHFAPTTATAAADTPYISANGRDVLNNRVIVTHANTADTDKTYKYTLIG